MTWEERLRLNWIVLLIGEGARPDLFEGCEDEWILSFDMADGVEVEITVPPHLWAEFLRRNSMGGSLDPFDRAARRGWDQYRRTLMKAAQRRLGREVPREDIAQITRRRTVLRRSP